MIDGIKNLINEENKQMTEQEDWYELEFEYLGYTAKVVRYREYSNLCGYVKTNFELSDEMYKALAENSHGGITYARDIWLGFDCGHAWDFDLDRYWYLEEIGVGADIETHLQTETYRDLDYAIETLKNMISAMTVERIKHENSEEERTMNELIKQVEQWSKDKDLDKADPNRQALKVWEESGEIGAALSRNKLDDLKDGIGDTVVTLIILAQQHGWSLEECLQYAYDEIKDRRGETRNGTFIKEKDL